MSTPTDLRAVPHGEQSVLADRRGLPWWGAVLLAFAMTGLGIVIDVVRVDTLTQLFLIFYAVGCVAAVLAVAHRHLFTAVVQPPLVLAITVPVVVRALGGGSTGGLRNAALELVLPLVNGFPTMALTSVATVVLGLLRLRLQRPGPSPAPAAQRDTPPRT